MTDRGGGAFLLPYTPAGMTESDDDDTRQTQTHVEMLTAGSLERCNGMVEETGGLGSV